MPFFEIKKDSKKKPSEFDCQCAQTLIATIQKKTNITRKWSVKKWSQSFRLLRESDGIRESRIFNALNWLCENLRNAYTPVVRSAKDFRDKFLRIEDVAGRDGVIEVVSDEAKGVVEKLRRKNWEGSEGELDATVETSLQNFRAFRKALLESKTPDGRLTRFAGWVFTQLPRPVIFVEEWMLQVQTDIDGWDAWSGDLQRMVFSMDSKKFTRTGRAWANEYLSDAASWGKLMEFVHESAEA